MENLSKMRTIGKMEDFFHQWYCILNPLQKIDVDNFLSKYPIHEIEEDIFSAAEKNNIKIDVPPARLFQVEVGKRINILECKFLPLVKTNVENKTDFFHKELFNLFEITKSTYPDKHITFYCMCPFIKTEEYRYGILGAFEIH